MELGIWRPRNHPLIVFKDAKGIKDCRAAPRAIFAKFPRSLCAGPIHREDWGKPRQQRELRDSDATAGKRLGCDACPFRLSKGGFLFEGRTFIARTPFEDQPLPSKLWPASLRVFPAPVTAIRPQRMSFIERLETDRGAVLFSRLLIRGFDTESETLPATASSHARRGPDLP